MNGKKNNSVLILILATIAVIVMSLITDYSVPSREFESVFDKALQQHKNLYVYKEVPGKLLVDEIPVWIQYHPIRFYYAYVRRDNEFSGSPNSSLVTTCHFNKGKVEFHVNYIEGRACILTVYHTIEGVELAKSIKAYINETLPNFPVILLEKDVVNYTNSIK